MLTESKLNEVLSRASKLMSPEGQRQIDAASFYNSKSFNPDGDFVKTPNIPTHPTSKPPTQNQVTNSKLPKAIRESIIQNPITEPNNEYNVSASILDSIPVPPKREVVTEQQYIPQYQSQPMSIDYNYIRSIINECIQTNLQQIKNEILQESQLKAIRIGGENKIQLIDNKNNLFESKLEFKKNISKNK